MKGFSLVMAGAFVIFAAAPVFAVCSYDETLRNSGQDQLVCIDTDKDGEIDVTSDCCLTGGVTTGWEAETAATGGDPLCLNANQSGDSGQMQIVGCGDRTTYTGTATPNSFVLTNQYGEGVPGFSGLDVQGSDGSSSMTYGFTGEIVREVAIGAPSFGMIGSGRLCNAGGPAVEVEDIHGMTYVARFTPLLSNTVHYLCALAPIPLAMGGMDMFNVCTPVMGGGYSVISTVNAAVTETTMIPFSDPLSACGGSRMAPTTGEFGLVGLALALLAGGTWLLRRRDTFADSL